MRAGYWVCSVVVSSTPVATEEPPLRRRELRVAAITGNFLVEC